MTENPSHEQREHDLTMHVFSIFVSTCFLSFWSFKTAKSRLRQRLRLFVDVQFMGALVLMVCVCAIIAYALI